MFEAPPPLPDRALRTESRVLMFTDLVGSSEVKVKLGDERYAQVVALPHNRLFRRLLKSTPGAVEIGYTGDGFFASFAAVKDAVQLALLFHAALRVFPWSTNERPLARIGVHRGDLVILEDGSNRVEQSGHAADMCSRVMSLALGGQTLLTRHAFDDGKQFVRTHPPLLAELFVDLTSAPLATNDAPSAIEWIRHGHYILKGKEDDPLEIFEVGAVGLAPLVAPADSSKARRAAPSAASANAAPRDIEAPPVIVAMPRVVLRVVAGPHAGEQFEFVRHETVVVGRAVDAQWRLVRDAYFSRYQFRVEGNPPNCRLIDLKSSNGTRVNGALVGETWLRDRDRIECGDTVFEVSIVAPSEAAGGDRRASSEALATRDAMPLTQDWPLRPPAPPRYLADFEVEREIGRGAMGVVYFARHRATGRQAAVKLIRPATPPRSEAMQLFLREACILSQLRHPRIVEYLSLGLHEGQMFLAMEHVPAEDFPQILAAQSREKQIRLACGVMTQMLDALQFAHERDVVHRDVKPSNVLVYRIEGRLHCKLVDFGLAKNYLNAGFSSISSENEVRGTLGFMAPEQLIDCRFAKPACDIYAVGACLYSFLSGSLPHDGASGPSAFGAILNGAPTPLGVRCRDLPQALTQAVDRALAREPADRYSSAAHMKRALLPFASK